VSENTLKPDLFESYQAFAETSDDKVLKRFQVIQRNGQMISIPYSLLPIFILQENSRLLIKSHDFEITLTGRSLDRLYESFCEELVLYVRESPSGTDDGKSSVFISKIEIEGDSLIF